jgi:hypothetical protein
MIFRRPGQQPGEQPPSIRDYAAQVESLLAAASVNVEQARLLVEGGYGWRFQRGSAIVQVYVVENDQRGYFQVFSPMLHLPAGGLLPLYRRMLELNLKLTSASLGVHNDIVYVFTERLIDGLDADEANTMINLVSGYADDLDNKLVAEFGGRLYSQV